MRERIELVIDKLNKGTKTTFFSYSLKCVLEEFLRADEYGDLTGEGDIGLGVWPNGFEVTLQVGNYCHRILNVVVDDPVEPKYVMPYNGSTQDHIIFARYLLRNADTYRTVLDRLSEGEIDGEEYGELLIYYRNNDLMFVDKDTGEIHLIIYIR